MPDLEVIHLASGLKAGFYTAGDDPLHAEPGQCGAIEGLPEPRAQP